MRDAWLTLDRDALAGNLRVLRQAMPEAAMLAMVKADAYGHGALTLAQWLAPQVEALGVAFLAEALALRAAGVTVPITILEGVFEVDELRQARLAGLTPIVHSPEQLDLVCAAPPGPPFSVWLKVNTGMNRLGLRPAEALKAWRRLREVPYVEGLGLMTHLASADDVVAPQTTEQLARFRILQAAIAEMSGHPVEDSVANSAGILAWPGARGAWMRPGIALYGSSPFPDTPAEALGLQPVMTLHARLIAVHEVAAGESVGYGATWTASAATRIGVVSIGYGDGYPRHAPTGTPVLVHGQRCRLVGRVSMDMITVDLGSVPARPGDAVVLWGAGLPVDEIAAAAGTISYELFCRLTPRVGRPA